jgi:hypothetical protein
LGISQNQLRELDGALPEEAATAGGMDRQTLRDWVIRFNK